MSNHYFVTIYFVVDKNSGNRFPKGSQSRVNVDPSSDTNPVIERFDIRVVHQEDDSFFPFPRVTPSNQSGESRQKKRRGKEYRYSKCANVKMAMLESK